MNSFIISNVRIVTPYTTLENGFIYVKRGIIEAIGQASPGRIHRSCSVIDGHRSWLFPGIIDIYNESFIKACLQDGNITSPIDPAFFQLESRLSCHGVTSIFHFVEDAGPEIPNELARLKKLGIIRHNAYTGQNSDGDYTLLNASGIIEEAGNSLNINLNDIIASNNAYIICSDSDTKSILQSIFLLCRTLGISMADAVKMATINPAKAMGLNKKLGSIEYGKNADMILVSCINDLPAVEMVFVNGCRVFENQAYINGNAV